MYDQVMEQTAVAPSFEAYPSDEVLEDAGNASSRALGPFPTFNIPMQRTC
jgi:hypothetical protein